MNKRGEINMYIQDDSSYNILSGSADKTNNHFTNKLKQLYSTLESEFLFTSTNQHFRVSFKWIWHSSLGPISISGCDIFQLNRTS